MHELEARAREIHGILDEIAQGKRTTGIARTIDSVGNEKILVASSAILLTPAQRNALRSGETPVRGKGHAEVTIIDHALKEGLTVVEIAASRPICLGCENRISEINAIPVSPLKGR